MIQMSLAETYKKLVQRSETLPTEVKVVEDEHEIREWLHIITTGAVCGINRKTFSKPLEKKYLEFEKYLKETNVWGRYCNQEDIKQGLGFLEKALRCA